MIDDEVAIFIKRTLSLVTIVYSVHEHGICSIVINCQDAKVFFPLTVIHPDTGERLPYDIKITSS